MSKEDPEDYFWTNGHECGDASMICARVTKETPHWCEKCQRAYDKPCHYCSNCADCARARADVRARLAQKGNRSMPPKKEKQAETETKTETTNENESETELAVEDDPDIRTESCERDLPVALTKDEIAQRADRAAHLVREHDEKEANMKAATTHAKSVLEELKSEHRRLSNEVRDKKTYRVVQCQRRHNYRTGKVFVVRLDTGEIVEERAMLDSERQSWLDFEAKQLKKEADDEGAKQRVGVERERDGGVVDDDYAGEGDPEPDLSTRRKSGKGRRSKGESEGPEYA